jgi:tRNA dimethylallyltransferase
MKNTPKKRVIIIAGPTAAGKTSVAIQLAKHFSTEIISADSRQCFKELMVGVARPSPEELQVVTHHFIASHSIKEEVTAVTFEQYALQKVNELFQKHDTVIMAGGTGLYIKAFCEGFDEIPAIEPEIRKKITDNYNTGGLKWLQLQIKEKDPVFFAEGEIQNPQRVMRALEVVEATGKSVLAFRKGEKAIRHFEITKIGLELSKEELHDNIHKRVDRMMETGLLEEVKSLEAFRQLNALQTVGYSELFAFLDGDITLVEATEQIRTHTRQYAKRQMTWFKKDNSIEWVSPLSAEKIIQLLDKRGIV